MAEWPPRTFSRRRFTALLLGGLAAVVTEPTRLRPRAAQAATVFPGPAWWVEATPDTQGVDPALLGQAMAYLDGVTVNEKTTQAMVIRNGYLIWKGSDIHTSHNVWSVTKSLTTTVLGLLIGDGVVTIDSFAPQFVPSLQQHYSTVTLRAFASMNSGYDAVGGDRSKTPFDAAAPLFSPGSHFLYWDSAMNQFANVLTRAANEPLVNLFARRIAEPIGMTAGEWSWGDWGEVDGLLVNGGAGNKRRGLSISASDLARIGLLYLNRGVWNGMQLLSPEWVDAATRVQVPNFVPTYVDGIGPGVYGFGWWVNGVLPDETQLWPDAPVSTYKASGFNDNCMWIIPDWNMVIVRLGTSGDVLTLDQENTFLKMTGGALF